VPPLALLVHVRRKLLERYLAVHYFTTLLSEWCGSLNFNLHCHSGCVVFAPNALERSTEAQLKRDADLRSRIGSLPKPDRIASKSGSDRFQIRIGWLPNPDRIASKA
jgi:hypothetical protein